MVKPNQQQHWNITKKKGHSVSRFYDSDKFSGILKYAAYHKFAQEHLVQRKKIWFRSWKKYHRGSENYDGMPKKQMSSRTRKKRFVIDIEEKEYSLLTNEEHRILTLDNIW